LNETSEKFGLHAVNMKFNSQSEEIIKIKQAWTGPEGSRKLRLPDFVTRA